MSRHSTATAHFSHAIVILIVPVILTGCNVLFVPRKPDPSPTATPITVVHKFPALEARIPDQIDGKTLQKFSLTTDPELQTAKTLAVLQRLGKTTADLELARASATGLDLTVAAMRIIGADANRAAATFEAIDEADPNALSVYQPAVVVGKRVLIRTTGDVVAYMYPLDDVIFILTGRRPLVEEALVEIR